VGDATPVSGIPTATEPSSARGPAVVTVVLLVAITWLGLPLRTTAAPLGIVSLQFAPGVDAATAILSSWSAVPPARLRWAHGLDLILPFAYATALLRAARGAAAAAAVRRGAVLTVTALAVLAAAADQVENVAMAVTMLGAPGRTTVRVTLVAAVVKTVALGGALVGSGLLAVRGRPVRTGGG
jgi:hypothetical protein